MKYWLLPVIALISVFAASAVLVSEEADADNTEYTIKGKIVDYNGEVSEDLSGTSVRIGENVGSVENGIFTVTVSADKRPEKLTISISLAGYIPAQTSIEYYTTNQSNKNLFDINLSSFPEGTTEFDLTSSPIRMSESYLVAYLMESGATMDTPLADTIVHLTDGFDNIYMQTTDSNGMFTIPIGSRYNLEMGFSREGYTPVPGLNFMYMIGNSVLFDLSGTIQDIGATYGIPSKTSAGVTTYTISSQFPILLSPSTGDVTVNVTTQSGILVEGCNVTLTSVSEPEHVYTGLTDKTGSVTISSVKTGEYILTTKVGGFENYTSEQFTVMKGSNPLPHISLVDKPEASIFGMNLYHFLMVVGIILSVVILVFSLLLFTKRLKTEIDEI